LGGILYNKDKTTLITYPAGKTDLSFTILNSVTKIESHAFYNCTSLNNITIGNNVTNIMDHAFNYCTGLVNVTFEGSIEQGSFNNNNSFLSDLRAKYFAEDGGIGTYTTTAPVSSSSVWTKQPSQ